jgi:O-antigen/teichoic acid export membrane protein
VSGQADSPLISFGRRLGRHSGIYVGGHVAIFIFGMANVAVLTRLLPIEEFGRLAVYLVLATLLTTLYNLGSLQGTLMVVFGVADDEELAVGGDEGVPQAENRERALTTGVLLTIAIAALGTTAVFATAPWLAELFGAPGELDAVRLAALCGASGAVWRLVLNVPRLERRPGLYSTLSLLRPAFALAVGVALVVAGFGVEGALAGLAIGTTLAIPVAILMGRHNYAFGLELAIVPQVFRLGAPIVPIIGAMWIITNVDVFLVSAYAPADAVGPYRVATRLGAGVSYLVSAVAMAWLPLRRMPLHTAVTDEHGPSGFGGTLLSVFLLFCIWVILALALLADLLIRVAPASYSSAAPLVPLIGLGIVAYGVMLLVYRGAKFPKRRFSYLLALVGAAVVFVIAGLVLVPAYGGYGAAAAQIVAFGGGAAVLLWLSQRSEHPLPIQYGRLARGLLLGLLCIALGQLLGPLAGDWRIAVDLSILLAFPALLYAAHAFPSEELRAFVGRPKPRSPRSRSAEIVAKLGGLDPLDRRLVAALAPRGAIVGPRALELVGGERQAMSRFVSSLRALAPSRQDEMGTANGKGTADGEGTANGESTADGEGSEGRDVEIAAYLLAGGGVAGRDRMGEKLCEEGVDPLDLDLLDLTLGRLRRIPRREWERLGC